MALWERDFSKDSVNVLANPRIQTFTSLDHKAIHRQKVSCIAEDFERIYLSSLPVYKLTTIRKISWDEQAGFHYLKGLEDFFRLIGRHMTKLESMDMVEVQTVSGIHASEYEVRDDVNLSAAAHWNKADELRPLDILVDTLGGIGRCSHESYFGALKGWNSSQKATVSCCYGSEDCRRFHLQKWRISIVKPDSSSEALTGLTTYDLQNVGWYERGPK